MPASGSALRLCSAARWGSRAVEVGLRGMPAEKHFVDHADVSASKTSAQNAVNDWVQREAE